MSPPRRPRLPFEPIDHATNGNSDDQADLFHLNRRTITRYRAHGVPIDQADRIACELGLHPSALWNDYYEVTA